MSFFHFSRQPDINEGVKSFHNTEDAILLDVRTSQEYKSGHIPGSRNLPLVLLDNAAEIIENEYTPIFVYCQSGNRSRQAVARLVAMGYSNVKNIGGIAAWIGEVESV